ncbi:hypothetical protein [Lentzea cavernae]|uniref:hypothetical protein n=1 Tax=Lentzea cavernae TaxID=2020703 RepID=UPI001E3A0A20|nr:hypothetical protein [Lentzea cavernae]
MATLEEIGIGLNSVLDKAAEAGAAMRTASDLVDGAQSLLASAVGGSLQPDVEATNAHFSHVVVRVTELHKTLSVAIDGVQASRRSAQRTARTSSTRIRPEDARPLVHLERRGARRADLERGRSSPPVGR